MKKNIQIALIAVVLIAIGAFFVGGWSSDPSESPEESLNESTATQTSEEHGASSAGSEGATSKPSGAGSQAPAPSAPAPASSGSLTGTQWSWQRTEFPNGLKTLPQDSAQFVITFGSGGQMTSMTDCNNIFGPFTVSGATLKIGPIAATDMACQQVTKERVYAEELARVVSYAIAGDELRMTLTNGPGTMVFKKHVAVGLEGTTFRLVSFSGNAIEGVYGGTYTVAFTDALLSAKFCNTFGGGYTLAAGRLTANMSGTKMNCGSPPKLMEMEYAFTSALQNGMQLSLKGSTLTLTGNKGEQFVFTVSGN